MPKNLKKIISTLVFAIALVGGFFIFKHVVLAQAAGPDLGLTQVEGSIGLPTTDIRLIIARIIRIALSLLGIVALVLVLYGGYTWMTAGGDDEKISQAKKILLNSVIGLAIILSSYALTSFVISKLTGATTGLEVGGSGAGPGGDNPYFPGDVFYVDSLPAGGTMCTRNIHVAVTFNRSVNLDSLDGNIVVTAASNGDQYPGSWQLVNDHTATFVPKGDCGEGEADCFAASTDYVLHFKNPTSVKSGEEGISLNCSLKAGCGDVKFTTGQGVDRTPPQLTIRPISKDILFAGSLIPVQIDYTDDNGVQKVDLSVDNYFAGSQSIPGCQKSGSVTINWPTQGIATGNHTITADGFDWSAFSYRTSTQVKLLPQHCFNDALEADLGEEKAGPPACGGECGACGGSPCQASVECGSGFCNAGFCKDTMRINGVSPLSGGPGTVISISGNYFGTVPGKVFINNVEANLGVCGANAWKPWQILAEVPVGAATGPIRVETAPDAKGNKDIDTTSDGVGPVVSDFKVDDVIHPSLCLIKPDSALPGTEVFLSGKRFGAAPGKIIFGQQNAVASIANWTDVLVKTRVPDLESGPLAVKISQNNIDSNALRFFAEEDANDSSPVISSITPDRGAKGEYITIVGKNFGNQPGRVWFKENNNGQAGDAIEGDFRFPTGCKNTWSDKQIIVKFPANAGAVGKSYFVQVRPADAAQSPSRIGPVFALGDGQPMPGICSLDPLSGPVPFDNRVHIVGEYLGEDPSVYFWNSAASATSTDGRIEGASSTVVNLLVGQSISTIPPAGVQTGPVVIARDSDKQTSNPLNFEVLDCVKNNNTCTAPNTHCCVSGGEAGLCRPNNQLCEGETLSAGYIWRFSTKDIPKIPHVVERCDANTDLGLNIPSPSPSTQWDAAANGEQHNICRSASVVVEFNMPTINNIPRSDFIVNECEPGTIEEANNKCAVSAVVPVDGAGDLVPQLSTENTNYLELNPDPSYNNGKWKDKTWYQVVLKSTITAGQGAQQAPLSKDKPCSPDSAYCFVFQTGAQDCRVKRVVVTPYSYWTSVLEEPMKKRENPADDGEDVVYSGHGLSTQRCVMMNMHAFAWSWDSSDNYYADIFSHDDNSARVSALANTVGLGLKNPDNAVNIKAKATLAAANYTGVSPLTIDLNNPEVVDFWPKCLEACTNAEVGLRFNTTMSNKNLPGSAISGPVKLLKCQDENCFNTVPVLFSDDVILDGTSEYKVLKLANSTGDSPELDPNSIYEVVVSASTTDIGSTDLLWSAARLGDPTTFSKPYDKEFVWKFKTKKDKCNISRVDVAPEHFVAALVNDKKIFTAQPYSSPDSCDAKGQKLNAWSVDWDWTSADAGALPNVVAKVQAFSSKGANQYCTKNCILKGSSIAFGEPAVPVCGNLHVEAGEDCDPPLKGAGCGLDCRRRGNSNPATCGNGVVEPNLGENCDPGVPGAIGCSKTCLRTGSEKNLPANQPNASVCGNGLVGAGEDCELGIAGAVGTPNSALNCSDTCLHTGTRLSSAWCFANQAGKGGFLANDFAQACKSALSRCGDGVQDPDEDPGCDVGVDRKADECNKFCLLDSTAHPECALGAEGCSTKRQKIGSSLLYTAPSVCGDGLVGTGEDAFCENNLAINHVGNNPWALVTGVGLGQVAGVPPKQKTDIIGTTRDNTVGGPISGKGEFSIACGFTSDQQCRDRMGNNWGLATNGCCYKRPELISVTPGTTTENKFNICPNTNIEAVFDQEIDPSSLKNNFVIARGTSHTSCEASEDVTNLVRDTVTEHLPWYKRAIAYVVNALKNLTGQKAEAIRDEIRSDTWCSGEDLGQAEVESLPNNQSKIVFRLNKPLAVDTDYFIAVKEGLRSKAGISIGKNNTTNKPLGWKFITGSQVCEVNKVSVQPAQLYFTKANVSAMLTASAYHNNDVLQSIPGSYAWEYVWQPTNTPQVIVSSTTSTVNTAVSQNRNGEADLRASAKIVENIYSAQTGIVASGNTHVIVFLCENPWPPKDLYVNGNGPFTIFPYEDKVGNNDGFNLQANIFDNSSIPPSPAGGYFNFRTYYCADNGRGGNTSDDLPYLYPAVQTAANIVADSPTSSLKRFIFTNNKNKDAIGIQIFSNPKHLTITDWFAADKALGGQGFTGDMTATKIDGYDAITDGNNIYVDALNYSDTSHNLFSNIYLFSINADADSETQRVFQQLLGNLKLNTNLTNYGYCGVDMNTPGVSTTCRTDFDCQNNEVCSVQTDKLKRNYQRLRDLKEIQDLFNP